MDFSEMLERDTALIFEDYLSGTQEVEVIPAGADKPVTVRAMFEAPGHDSAPAGISTAVVSNAPMLHIPQKQITSALGRPLSTRDVFVIRGKSYRPQNPQDDGFGLLSCKLLETGNA